MHLRLANKMMMYNAVIEFLESKTAIVVSIVQFGQSLLGFKSIVKDINDKEGERQTVASGKTEVKQSAQKTMIVKTVEVAAGLFTYAKKNGLIEVKTLADVKDYKLRQMKNVDLLTKCTKIYDAAKSVETLLADFDVTPAMLTDFKTKIDVYENSLGEKESSMGKRKGAGKTLLQLFNSADEILKDELDRFAEKLTDKNPAFYEDYHSVRNIKNIGIRHREAKENTAKEG
jgi:hypothetical protein